MVFKLGMVFPDREATLTVVDSCTLAHSLLPSFPAIFREAKTNAPPKATMKVLFHAMICAVLAILSLTVCHWPTPGAGATRPFLTSSKGEREPATLTEAAVDNNNDNKASRDPDSHHTTTTKAIATATATTVTTNKATAKTSATRMRQQRSSRRHRSLVFANLFAWIKKIFCYIFGQKFGFCSPPTPTCRTGPNAFTNRQQLNDALSNFFANGYTANLQQYGANMNEWDVSAITDFSQLFEQRGAFNKEISCWNVGAGTKFEYMFYGATNFNQDIGQWNAGTDFTSMFASATNFNQDIGRWNVGAGTKFEYIFYGATNFNQDIGQWNVGAGIDFTSMFASATNFNQDIGRWSVGAGTNFGGMFAFATSFNQDIGQWNVGAGTTFLGMFDSATSFNQDIGKWNVGAGTNFSVMFQNARAFNQDLCAWGGKMQNTAQVRNMFLGANTCANQADPNFAGTKPGPFCTDCN
jgi:hypothetical protein